MFYCQTLGFLIEKLGEYFQILVFFKWEMVFFRHHENYFKINGSFFWPNSEVQLLIMVSSLIGLFGIRVVAQRDGVAVQISIDEVVPGDIVAIQY
jgi:hypothetical protein